jgi:hypothetical protein
MILIDRSLLSFAMAALLASPPCCAYYSPLSDESVREAYFLGQRHDASFLGEYLKSLPPPKAGPYVSKVTFLTPFAQLAQYSSSYVGNYSAQQAELDHRQRQEFVKIIVEIQLTNSYGAFIPDETIVRRGSTPGLIRRPYDFWKDFQVQVLVDNKSLTPSSFLGKPNSICGRHGPCILTGATLELQFPADAFSSDPNVQVIPPEGDQVSVDFDLTRLR